ncbi:MAG: DUF2490 domain-containing protein [Flavobacteriia bacterium]|jgi:hypothetical protein|nr:DUF2490 domain-containing protein [Flavobacteriia bacterium]NBP29413.1 DUF2490 domain-containing protein [Flavobacteriia bacterium]
MGYQQKNEVNNVRFSFFFAVLITVGSLAAQKNISNQFHAWTLYTGTHKITNTINLMTEYQWRRSDGFQHWQQSLLRLGMEYTCNPKLSVMIGYAWIKTFPYGSQPVLHEYDEHRIFEQVNVKDKVGRFEVQQRFRVEQRFLEQYVKNASGTVIQVDPVFRNRIRYRAMVMVPISQKDMSDNTLFLNLNNELFIGFGEGIAKNPLDQNRFIAALGWRFNSNANLQVGYLNQFVIKTNAIDMERNHSIWISMAYNVDFTKMFEKK